MDLDFSSRIIGEGAVCVRLVHEHLRQGQQEEALQTLARIQMQELVYIADHAEAGFAGEHGP